MLKNRKEIIKGHDFRHRYIYGDDDKRAGVIVVVRKDGKHFEGYSICSKQEPVFDKDLGKAIAILRAVSGKADFNKVPDKFKEQVERKLPTMYVNYEID